MTPTPANTENVRPITFRASIHADEGKTTTGIQVPEQIIEALGAGKRPPVRVTFNGYTYRSSIAPLGGVYMISVSAEVRKNAGVSAGDEVDVTLELDTQPREVEVPPDLSEALNKDSGAKQAFEGLSYSNKRRIVLPIEDAKTPETRQRRVEKAVENLRAGKI